MDSDSSHTLVLEIGLPESHRMQAAELYDQAFGEKFARAITRQDKRIDIFAEGINTEYCISAWQDERLVGLTGFQLKEGSFTGGISWEVMRKHLGMFAAMKASLLLSLYERKPAEGIFQMDGIVVHPEFRGHGIGTQMFDKLKEHAISLGYQAITLDVININPRAKMLYKRMGFEVTSISQFRFLKPILGFESSETMHLQLC